MKVCPVCNETFEDDLRFCDLDGTRLKRQLDDGSNENQNKIWSLLGVGLLVGALVLSAVSVIFFPKARVAPDTAGSESTPAITSNSPGTSQDTIAEATPGTPELIVEETAPPDSKKKEKAQNPVNGNFNGSALNPKAAAQSAEENAKSAAQTEEQKSASSDANKSEPPLTVKTASETRDTEVAPKPAQPAPEVKKDQKRQASDEKDSADKKADDKDKKKGGFFRVFKKLFGGGDKKKEDKKP